MSTWFNRLTRLYSAKRITKAGLKTAVERGWITEEEYQQITGEAYT